MTEYFIELRETNCYIIEFIIFNLRKYFSFMIVWRPAKWKLIQSAKARVLFNVRNIITMRESIQRTVLSRLEFNFSDATETIFGIKYSVQVEL